MEEWTKNSCSNYAEIAGHLKTNEKQKCKWFQIFFAGDK